MLKNNSFLHPCVFGEGKKENSVLASKPPSAKFNCRSVITRIFISIHSMKMDSWVEDRSFWSPRQDKRTMAQVPPSLDIHKQALTGKAETPRKASNPLQARLR